MDGTEIGISDFGAFDSGQQTTSKIKGEFDTALSAINNASTSLSEDIFMGPIANNCREAITETSKEVTTCIEALTAVNKLLSDVYTNYKNSDMDAIKKLLSISSDDSTTDEQVTEANSNTGKVNQDYLYNYLAEQGFNKAAICGILANIEYESGFKTSCVGDKGTSYGICQWHNSRWTRLKNYCKENNLDSSSIEGQAKFLVHELKTYYPSVYNKIKSVPNTRDGAYQAASAWTIHYEVPANKNAQARKRGNRAMSAYWDSYAKT